MRDLVHHLVGERTLKRDEFRALIASCDSQTLEFGSLPSPSPTSALLLQHPVGCKETCCGCRAGGAAAPAHVELTVHEGPGASPC